MKTASFYDPETVVLPAIVIGPATRPNAVASGMYPAACPGIGTAASWERSNRGRCPWAKKTSTAIHAHVWTGVVEAAAT